MQSMMRTLSSSRFARVLPCPTIGLLVPHVILAIIYFLVFPNNLKLKPALPVWRNGDTYTAKSAGDLRVFLGVFIRPDMYERREILRLAYSLQPRPRGAVVDVRFVLCRLDREEDAALVALEIIAHGDILVLNCTEKTGGGKTDRYFSAVPRLFAEEPYHYVGKTDDDTYYRLAALADTLRTKPRRDMFHAFLAPCHQDAGLEYMHGMGNIVSWDVAVWISATEALRHNNNGPKDMVLARWNPPGSKDEHMYREELRVYDYLDRQMKKKGCYRHELMPDTVAVHDLKDRLKWARTLKFFNATQGLKPSKMYHA